MGVKSSLSINTWYIWGGLVRWVRRSSTTELPSSRSGSTGFLGVLGVAMAPFYRAINSLAFLG